VTDVNAVLPDGNKWAGPIDKLSDYLLYHKLVVDECVRLTAEKHRKFYDGMDYREEWKMGIPADETADANVDATDWEEE